MAIFWKDDKIQEGELCSTMLKGKPQKSILTIQPLLKQQEGRYIATPDDKNVVDVPLPHHQLMMMRVVGAQHVVGLKLVDIQISQAGGKFAAH